MNSSIQPNRTARNSKEHQVPNITKIIKTVAVGLVVAIAIGMMIFTVISVSTFDRTDRSLFGMQAFIVLTDSMKATDFDAGDLVLVKEVDPSTLREGDIISYTSTDTDNFGEIVTHKIRSLTITPDGKPGFITYGTTTRVNDKNVVTYEYVIGQYKFRIANLGHFFQFLKTAPGYIVCILLPFLILIGVQGYNSVKIFKQYRSEQMESIRAEREALEKERRQSQAMMAELIKMKEQLGLNKQPSPPTSPKSAPQKPNEN